MTKYALSTYGQGANCYISLPARLANTASSAWIIGGTAICHDFTANRNYLGDSASTQTALRFYPDGSVAMRASANDRITAPAGSAVVDEVFAWEIRNNTDTGNWEFYFNDLTTPVGVYPRGSAAWAINQLCRFSTTASPFFTTLSFYTAGAATFVDSWDYTTAVPTGTDWLSTSGTRSLTIVSAAGAPDSWWQLYDATQIGEGTASISAAAAVAVSGSKVGNAKASAVAAAVAAVQGSKIGSAQLGLPIAAGIVLSGGKTGVASLSMPVSALLSLAAHKVGASHIYIVAVADIALYAGNIYVGEGTFTVSAAVTVGLQGEKVGQSQVQFEAAAAVYCSTSKLGAGTASAMGSGTAQLQANKAGHAMPQVTAAAALAVDGYKVGFGSVAVLASASISLTGSNPAAVPAPVTMVFVRTSSRYQHMARTSGRYSYNIKTSSGGARV